MISTMRERKEEGVVAMGGSTTQTRQVVPGQGSLPEGYLRDRQTDQIVLKGLEEEHYRQGKTQGQSCRAMSKRGV